MDRDFRWLHFSDVHVGLDAFKWQWPTMKAQFLDDLEAVFDLTGKWDLVVFSGDLVQSGEGDEFDLFTQLLSEIWEKFDKLGCRPDLVSVPGNHDLVRPAVGTSCNIALGQWWGSNEADKSSVRHAFWDVPTNEYRVFLKKVFENYKNWQNKAVAAGIPLLIGKEGILPGDFSISVPKGELSIGLVGLNSSFLQLTGNDYTKKLALDTRQLLDVTGHDPHKWASHHDLTLLITHHPVSWLHDDAIAMFESDIYTPKLFDAHLFGHMHETNATAIAAIGSNARRYMQAPSLFGLEKADNGRIDRIHGYTSTVVKIDGNSNSWKFWPRIAKKQNDGEYRPVPDYSFKLTKEQCAEESASPRNKNSLAMGRDEISATLSTVEFESGLRSKQPLINSRFQLPVSPEQTNVRVLAQESCVQILQSKRLAWLDSEWGMNPQGFIWSVLNRLGNAESSTYRIDASKFQSMEQFLPLVSEHLGCSFAAFCKALSEEKSSILLFDDVPADCAVAFLELCNVVLDFCPKTLIFIVSRGTQREVVAEFQQLKALDEIETRAYVARHAKSNDEMKNAFAASEIFRISDGLPSEIDRAIGKLRYVPVADLGASFFLDSAQSPPAETNAPHGLVKAVSSIQHADDPYVQRAFYLLKILTVLPYGESIRRLRHFDPVLPIFDQQAEELLERSLIEPRTTVQVIGTASNSNERAKILVAPRSVRDYVRTLMSAEEAEKLTNLAMRLYFGEKWRDGEPKFKLAEGFATTEDGAIFHNPHSLLLRLLGSAVSANNVTQISAIVALCKSYAASLRRADHYRSLVTVSRDVLRILPDSYDPKTVQSLELDLARGLRMIGEHDEAISLLAKLKDIDWDKEHKRSVLLNLALCLESKDDAKAVAVAKELLALDPNSGAGIQAKAIILASEEGSKARLRKLETQARRKGNIAAANNLAINRAEETADLEQVEKILDEVIKSAKSANDWYNVHRAEVKIAVRIVDEDLVMTPQRLRAVISAYYYFYSQRFRGLFKDAHHVLWRCFEKAEDIRGLVSLFRQSSFVWRLSSRENLERKYLKSLIAKESHLLERNVLLADQDTAYFILRARNMAT